MGDRLGQQLGNYRLVKLLGQGGFAEVYLGQHVHLASKQAAIKILHLLDVDARKFQEEAETTEQLVHPHIVRLLDFAIEQGTPFLVLDYAPGGSLRTRHPKGSIVPLASVGAYLKELASALQYAHDQHILHRDIKPDNMLIGRQGELLLSDFGIAVLTQTGRTSLSAAYNIGGTPYYMAPETYRGRPVKASDQYALAVVIYEWLCGRVPFSQGDFIQLGFQHSHEPVPPLREKNPAIPSQVEAVIMKALAKEPKDRFVSVQTFAQAFEQACIQARQAEQARLGAEEHERARRAEEERLRDVNEAREKAREERLRRAKEAREKAREEQAHQAEAEQARQAVEERRRQAEEKERARQSEAERPRQTEGVERVGIFTDSLGHTSQPGTIPSPRTNVIQSEDASNHSSDLFRRRYLLGLAIFLFSAIFIVILNRLLLSNGNDLLLVTFGSVPITVSTFLYLVGLIVLIVLRVVLVHFDLFPRSIKRFVQYLLYLTRG